MVEPDQFYQNLFQKIHRRSRRSCSDRLPHKRSRVARIRALSRPRTGALATTTTSRLFLSNFNRKDSLIKRRIRFLLTEFPAVFLLTTIPSLFRLSGLSIARTRNSAQLARNLARLKTASNSRAVFRRWSLEDPLVAIAHFGERLLPGIVSIPAIRRREPCDPWPDAVSTPAGRSSLPFSRENRDCAYV